MFHAEGDANKDLISTSKISLFSWGHLGGPMFSVFLVLSYRIRVICALRNGGHFFTFVWHEFIQHI